jgi:hypothetical protein
LPHVSLSPLHVHDLSQLHNSRIAPACMPSYGHALPCHSSSNNGAANSSSGAANSSSGAANSSSGADNSSSGADNSSSRLLCRHPTHLHGLCGVLTWMQPDTLPLVAYAYICHLMHANMHDSLLRRACLFVPLPWLVCCVHQQYGAFVAWQRPSAMCASAWPGLLHSFFWLPQWVGLCSLLPGLTAALEACLLFFCDLCSRCHVMTRVATLHQQRPGVLATPPPARGRPVADLLLCLCCVCVFSGNFLRAAQSPCLLVLLGLE